MKINCLALFVMDIATIRGKYLNLDYEFASQINEFIYTYYKQNEELFDIIYDINLINTFAKNHFEILPLESFVGLLYKYSKIDNYIELLEQVGIERANKINELALQFIEYQNILFEQDKIFKNRTIRILQ